MVLSANRVTMKKENNNFIAISKYVKIILILACCSAFYGINTILNYVITTVWMLMALYLIKKDDFWTLFIPLSIFENTIFFYFTQYTVFKILLLVSLFKILISLNGKSKLTMNRYLIIFILLIFYAIFNLPRVLPGTISIIICCLTIFMMCFSINKMQNSEYYRRALFAYAIFAVAAGIYGTIHGNTLETVQNGVVIMRFCGTSSDPNIMSFKFLIGLIALFFTDIIKSSPIKIILSVFIIIMTFRTASTTAIIALGLYAMIIVVLQKPSFKKAIISLISIVIVVIVLLNVENLLTYLSSLELSGKYFTRILEQYHSFVGGDLSSATSLRTDVWAGYVDYFFNQQSFINQIFGGNVCNVYGIEKDFANMGNFVAPHNANIDIFMSIGVLGAIVIYSVIIFDFINDIRRYIKEKTPLNAMRVSVKIMAIFYTFSLSMFLSYGFMALLL